MSIEKIEQQLREWADSPAMQPRWIADRTFVTACSRENIRALLDELSRLRGVERMATEAILAVYDECERVAVEAHPAPYRQVELYRKAIRQLKARALSEREGQE